MAIEKIKFDYKQVEALASRGLTKFEISKCLGVSERTIYTNQKEDAEFAEAIKRGKAKGIQKVANALFENATKHNNLGAQVFFMKNQAGWKGRVDHTSGDERISTIPSFGEREQDA
jgi:hypothetical protein